MNKESGPSSSSSAPPGGEDSPDHSMMDVLRQDVREALGGPKKPPVVSPETALAALNPLPIPRIAVTVHESDAETAVEALRRIPQSVPQRVTRQPVQIELRLDPLKDDQDRAQVVFLVARLGVPVILTHRSPEEGGSGDCTTEKRQELLAQILKSLSEAFPPGSLIDVESASLEADPEGWRKVLAAAQEKNLFPMASHHDREKTPADPDALVPSRRDFKVAGFDALLRKSATVTRDWREELVVLAAMRKGNLERRRAVIMGMGRPTSRILAPFFGVPLVYSSTPGKPPVAPGQVPFDDLLHTWCRWGITYHDRGLLTGGKPGEGPPRWVLLGHPAVHSLSPAMHNEAARQHSRSERYFPLEAPAGDADARFDETLPWLPELGVKAGNATAPFKQALARAAGRLEGDAQALGAANAFRFDGNDLVATNTDVEGIRVPLEQAGVQVEQERVLVLGAGGAAAAAAYALRDARELRVSNRTPERAEALAKRLGDHAAVEVVPWQEREDAARSASLVVQATMMGMDGHAAEAPVSADALGEDVTVFEMVYDPVETPLLVQARESGAKTVDGLEMLLAQGAASYRFWTGNEAPVDVMRIALMAAREIPLPRTVREGMQQPLNSPVPDQGGDEQ